jgi:hypothetical protein
MWLHRYIQYRIYSSFLVFFLQKMRLGKKIGWDVQNYIQRCNIRCDMRYDVDSQGDQRQKQVCVNTPVAILDNVRSRIRAG